MKTVGLKKAFTLLGYKNIEISRGYNYRSGFMEKDGQLFYFMTGDLRDRQDDNFFVLVRTAKDRKDYIGGPNTYPVIHALNRLGYKLSVPRTKCDYNSN